MTPNDLKYPNEIRDKSGVTYVRQGFTSPQYCVYTEFIAAKSSISDRKTFTFTTLSMVVPAASRTCVRFLMH